MKKYLVAAAVAFLPVVALAAGSNNLSGVETNTTNALASLTRIVNAVIPFLVAIAVVIFIWGVVKYVVSPGAEDKAVARGYIIYGIIGIAVILSIFGLVRIVQNTFGIGNQNLNQSDIPQINP